MRSVGGVRVIIGVAVAVLAACKPPEPKPPASNPAPAEASPPAAPRASPAPTGAAPETGPAAATAPAATPPAPAAPRKAAAGQPTQWETDSGILVEELKIGEGEEATKFADVKVHYIGHLANGREFENSYRGNQPLVVNLGTGMIIKGWKDGIPGMKVGGKRRLTIPPELAYGKSGHPPMIGPDAMLVFDIELLEIVK